MWHLPSDQPLAQNSRWTSSVSCVQGGATRPYLHPLVPLIPSLPGHSSLVVIREVSVSLESLAVM